MPETLLLTAPEEIFPIVNSRDQVIDTTTNKDRLHKEGHLHRGVHVFIETFGGGFVLQKKAKGTENGGKWSSAVSGHVRFGESYIAAAMRETEEELGLEIEENVELMKIACVHPCEETGNEFVTLYSYLMDANESIKENSEEIDSIIICPRKEVMIDVSFHKELYSPAFVTLFNIFIEFEKETKDERSS